MKLSQLTKGAVAATLIASASLAHSAQITVDLEDLTNGGGFFGQVIFEDVGTDTVRVTADIADPINIGLSQGDILGLWTDVSDESILSEVFSFLNQDPLGIVTGSCFAVDGCDGPSGSGGAFDGFDIGVELGTQGAADGFIQTLGFDLMATGLSSALFDGQRVGLRVQSIEGDNSFGFNEGSSKLINDDPGPDVTLSEPGIIAMFLMALGGLGLSRQSRRA